MDSVGEIVFTKRCSDTERIKSGYYVPIDDDLEVVVTYDGIKAEIWINGNRRISKEISFSFKCGNHIDIGGYSATKSEVWKGFINYVVIYDVCLDSKSIKNLK